MLAIVAVLAWSSRPSASPAPAPAQSVKVVQGPNGKQHLALVKAPAHATTATSGVVH
jgi:hypothetical protein